MDPSELYQIRGEVIKAHITALQVELEARKGYVYNSTMQLECDVLRKTIAGLRDELRNITEVIS